MIIKDPDRFALRRKMWDLFLTGKYSVPQITDIANSRWGYRTRGSKRHPSGPVSRNSVYHMLKNPRYAGLIPVPGKPDAYEKASYEPMVSIEEFDRAQELLGIKGTRKLAARKVFTYRGLLLCGECGCAITAEEKTRYYKNGNVQSFIYYHCTHKRPCTQRKNLNETKLEKQFDEELSKYTIIPQFKEWALEVLDNQNEIEATGTNAVLAAQNRAIESTHKQIKKLIGMAAKELISEDEFLQEKKELDKQIKDLEKELADTKHRAESWYVTFTKTFELAIHGRERFMNGDISVKREILSNLGQNPVLLEGELRINTYPWLQLIEKEYPKLEAAYRLVRTQPQQTQKASVEAIRSTWLGVRDSNPRMPGPKPGALPLGEPPTNWANNRVILAQNGVLFNDGRVKSRERL